MSQKALLGILVMVAALLTPVQRPFNTWKSYGGGVDSSQYSSLKQIDKTNVKQLQVAWTFRIGRNSSTSFVAAEVNGRYGVVGAVYEGVSKLNGCKKFTMPS